MMTHDAYQAIDGKPTSMKQNWSFNSLNSEGAGAEDYASDEAQPDTSDGNQSPDRELSDKDMSMVTAEIGNDYDEMEAPPAPDASAQIALSDIQNAVWGQKGVISVPPAGSDDGGSGEVAEIHVEGESGSKGL